MSATQAKSLVLGLLLVCTANPQVVIANTDASTYKWETVHAQSPKPYGDIQQPSIRYGHTCTSFGGSLILSHGYFFDRDTSTATWKSDTWKMSYAKPYKWQQLSPGASQDEALAAYAKGRVPGAPCGRFGHASAVIGNHLWLYGGHDGGYSRHGRSNYEPGYDFDELWRLDILNNKWEYVLADSAASPGKRYLSRMAAVGELLLLYGGMLEGQGDVWAFNISSRVWAQLSVEVSLSQGGPGRRVGHNMFATDQVGAQGLVLYGGRLIDGTEPVLDPKVWVFDLAANSWRSLHSLTDAPGPRLYHAMMPAQVGSGVSTEAQHMLVGVVAGGTTTTPALTCTDESWAFTLDCHVTSVTWHRLPPLPIPVYDLAGAAGGDQAFVFGGHFCSATKGDMPFYYTNMVSRLNLSGLIKATGCLASGSAAGHLIHSASGKSEL